MARQIINIGTVANDGTGDTIRDGGDKINANFIELYDALGNVVSGIWAALTGSYASATTFTFTGTDKDVNLIQLSLLTCTDSAGTTRRIGYVKSASNASGTITATVVSGDNYSCYINYNVAAIGRHTAWIHATISETEKYIGRPFEFDALTEGQQ